MITNKYSFQDIINDGIKYGDKDPLLPKNNPNFPFVDPAGSETAGSVLAHEAARVARMYKVLTQGGKFDAQRDGNYVVYQGSIDNANYNVGVWSAAAGVPREAMIAGGTVYSYFKSMENYLEGNEDYHKNKKFN